MKYIYFGTPEFAAIILEKLIKAGFLPAAVVCNPDKPVGRKQILTAPAVKQLIANRKAQSVIMQPENLLTIRDSLFALRPDFFVVASYAKIIPKEILEIPGLGSIGVHPSLLPKYRGSSPIQSAILAGEKETGVSLFLMDEMIDHGSIISNEKLEMRNENYETLMRKLAELGGDLLIEFLRKYENIQNYEKITGTPQDESQATFTKKFKTEDGFVDLEKDDPIIIERKIRALNPEPGVWTNSYENTKIYEITKALNKRVKILEAEIVDGKLKLKKIQIEGKKPTVI